MRPLLTMMLALLPGFAGAHPGHLAEVAGHDHALAGAAIAIAIGVAIWGALKGRKDAESGTETDEPRADEDPQET